MDENPIQIPFNEHWMDEMEANKLISFTPVEKTMSFAIGTPMKEIEQVVILKTLKSLNYNRVHTAKQLGIGIRTLQRKLKKYGKSNYGFE